MEFFIFFLLVVQQAVSPSHTRTHRNQMVRQRQRWSQKSLGGYLKEDRNPWTEEWDANVMIESVAILIDGLIR